MRFVCRKIISVFLPTPKRKGHSLRHNNLRRFACPFVIASLGLDNQSALNQYSCRMRRARVELTTADMWFLELINFLCHLVCPVAGNTGSLISTRICFVQHIVVGKRIFHWPSDRRLPFIHLILFHPCHICVTSKHNVKKGNLWAN